MVKMYDSHSFLPLPIDFFLLHFVCIFGSYINMLLLSVKDKWWSLIIIIYCCCFFVLLLIIIIVIVMRHKVSMNHIVNNSKFNKINKMRDK